MKQQAKQLTQEQAKAIGIEYKKLIELATQQLTEHKLWLQLRLRDLEHLPLGMTRD